MVNAIQLAMELNSLLPATMRPEHTEGYEGFFHLVGIKGEVEHAEMSYIIRDHDKAKFEQKKALIEKAVAYVNEKHGGEWIHLTLKDQYYNMREKVEPHPEIIEKAMQAMEEAGVTPIVKPIRGGTDGSRLSYMGLPCPNLFTGGMNFHGKFEYVSLDSMYREVHTLINLVKLWAK